MTSNFSSKIIPTDSSVELRDMTNGRFHKQGSLHDVLSTTAPVWGSIPHYTGHIRAEKAEGVFGVTSGLAKEHAEYAADQRRKPADHEFRQSSDGFACRKPEGNWASQSLPHWKAATHGLTQQDRAPHGQGTK
jgi:hypothetical protein